VFSIAVSPRRWALLAELRDRARGPVAARAAVGCWATERGGEVLFWTARRQRGSAVRGSATRWCWRSYSTLRSDGFSRYGVGVGGPLGGEGGSAPAFYRCAASVGGEGAPLWVLAALRNVAVCRSAPSKKGSSTRLPPPLF